MPTLDVGLATTGDWSSSWLGQTARRYRVSREHGSDPARHHRNKCALPVKFPSLKNTIFYGYSFVLPPLCPDSMLQLEMHLTFGLVQDLPARPARPPTLIGGLSGQRSSRMSAATLIMEVHPIERGRPLRSFLSHVRG